MRVKGKQGTKYLRCLDARPPHCQNQEAVGAIPIVCTNTTSAGSLKRHLAVVARVAGTNLREGTAMLAEKVSRVPLTITCSDPIVQELLRRSSQGTAHKVCREDVGFCPGRCAQLMILKLYKNR